MASTPGNEPDVDAADEERRVAEALAGIESAVRQRHAQLASLLGEREAAKAQMLELKSSEFVQEPVATSPRPVVGRLLVFLRKSIYHLFGKWVARPVIQQQNRFNQAARRMLVDQEEAIQRLAAEVEEMRQRLRERSPGRDR